MDQDELNNVKEEMAGIRQLYELKCREAELLR
jgi:hypothetical protein